MLKPFFCSANCEHFLHKTALLLGLLLLGAAGAPSALANTVYTYAGTPFSKCQGAYIANCSSDSVKGSFDTTLSLSQLENLNDFIIPASDIVSFSFTDGFDVSLNQSTAAFSFFEISTDSHGNITSWAIFVLSKVLAPNATNTGVSGIVTGSEVNALDLSGDNLTIDCTGPNTPPVGCSGKGIDGGSAKVSGDWSLQGTTAPTPEPPSLLLLGTGLLGLGLLVRRFA